ncbi:MAG TPA: PsbP-related protein [Ktedonobacterales bacterium]|nr:PsbP-related protein [Ktedonobacterales bacterium]
MPLGVLITLGLLLIFVIAGVGIYAIANGSGGQNLPAFTTYKDPGNQFSIQYPTVWTAKKLSNGVQFSDATNTVSLSVTYTPNTANLSATTFANQEAAKENINTPDSQTFAGTTWVQRSGIVTQTSGISQDIFIFVAASNNLLYEVREVAPLDGYKEPNQTDFMPMLNSLKLGQS